MDNILQLHNRTKPWKFTERLCCSTNESDKVRFEYALDPTGKVRNMLAIQGPSGFPEVDVTCLNCVEIPHQWTQSFFTMLLHTIADDVIMTQYSVLI